VLTGGYQKSGYSRIDITRTGLSLTESQSKLTVQTNVDDSYRFPEEKMNLLYLEDLGRGIKPNRAKFTALMIKSLGLPLIKFRILSLYSFCCYHTAIYNVY
jgi:hypothetical protein